MQNISEIEELIKLISKLPGLGPKSAKRIVLKLINNRDELVKPMASTLAQVYKNVTRWVKTELTKCNLGLSDKIFTSYPQSCPMIHSNNFASGMNNACRGQGGIFSQMKNPYKPTERLCDLEISYKNDNDVGKVNFSQKDWQNVRFSSCWKTPCSSSDNHEEIIINVTE